MTTLWTLRKLADFISEGPEVWYEVLKDKSIMFYDGDNDEKEWGAPFFKSYR